MEDREELARVIFSLHVSCRIWAMSLTGPDKELLSRREVFDNGAVGPNQLAP